MNELLKLVIACKRAISNLDSYIRHYKVELPVAFAMPEMREWFLVMQGYAECLTKYNLVIEID